MKEFRVWASAVVVFGSAACATLEGPRLSEPREQGALGSKAAAPACELARSSLDGPPKTSQTVTPTMSDDKRWLLLPTKDAAAIWSVGDASVKLTTRIAAGGSWSLHKGGRTYGHLAEPRSLFVVDPEPTKVTRLEDVSGFADGARSLVLVGDKSIRRLDRASLQEVQAVHVPDALGSVYSVRFLEKTQAVVVNGDKLVSFENAAVRSFGEAQLLATSEDQRRLIVCSPTELGVVDTTTGQTIAEWSVEDTTICQRSEPTITPDGRYVLAVDDIRPDDRPEGIMEVVVFEVETGKTRRLRDTSDGFGTSHGAHASYDRRRSRLCVAYGTGHWHATKCDWVVGEQGDVTLRPEKLPRPASVKGTELVRATSPDGRQVALVTSSVETDDEVYKRKDFRFTLFDARTKQVLHRMMLAPGTFAKQHTTLDPGLVFAGPERVTFHPVGEWIDISNGKYLVSAVIDVGARRVVPLQDLTHDFENGFMLRSGLYDVASDRTIPLDESTWSAAPIVHDRCAPWMLGSEQ